MLDGFFRQQTAFLEKYYGSKLNDVQYRLLWDYFQEYNEEYFKDICSKLIETFHPTSQNPFPLIIHFLDAKDELSKIKENYVIPDYKMLPEPDGERMTPEEIELFFREIKEKIGNISNKWTMN